MPAQNPIATRLSTKGQVVLPKAIRERRNWRSGADLVWEETPDGVLLRSKVPARTISVDDLIGSALYRGPKLSEAEVQKRLTKSFRAEHPGDADA